MFKLFQNVQCFLGTDLFYVSTQWTSSLIQGFLLQCDCCFFQDIIITIKRQFAKSSRFRYIFHYQYIGCTIGEKIPDNPLLEKAYVDYSFL